MASVDELLQALSDDNYLHDNIQFVIDENLRTITIPQNGVVLGVIDDKNVNRINFQMPKIYNGFDMSEFTTRVNYINANGDVNFYLVRDLTVEGDMLLFTWLVDSDATAYVGNVSFSVQMTKHNDDGIITQKFQSTIGTAKVLDGIIVEQSITPEQQRELLYHYYRLLDDYTELKIDELNNFLKIIVKYETIIMYASTTSSSTLNQFEPGTSVYITDGAVVHVTVPEYIDDDFIWKQDASDPSYFYLGNIDIAKGHTPSVADPFWGIIYTASDGFLMRTYGRTLSDVSLTILFDKISYKIKDEMLPDGIADVSGDITTLKTTVGEISDTLDMMSNALVNMADGLSEIHNNTDELLSEPRVFKAKCRSINEDGSMVLYDHIDLDRNFILGDEIVVAFLNDLTITNRKFMIGETTCWFEGDVFPLEAEEDEIMVLRMISYNGPNNFIISKFPNLKYDLKKVFTSVSDGKQLVASAITDKGVETASDATFETMADNIMSIAGGGEGFGFVDIDDLSSRLYLYDHYWIPYYRNYIRDNDPNRSNATLFSRSRFYYLLSNDYFSLPADDTDYVPLIAQCKWNLRNERPIIRLTTNSSSHYLSTFASTAPDYPNAPYSESGGFVNYTSFDISLRGYKIKLESMITKYPILSESKWIDGNTVSWFDFVNLPKSYDNIVFKNYVLITNGDKSAVRCYGLLEGSKLYLSKVDDVWTLCLLGQAIRFTFTQTDWDPEVTYMDSVSDTKFNYNRTFEEMLSYIQASTIDIVELNNESNIIYAKDCTMDDLTEYREYEYLEYKMPDNKPTYIEENTATLFGKTSTEHIDDYFNHIKVFDPEIESRGVLD